MAIAITLHEYLDNRCIGYKVIEHPYTNASMQTAQAAHIPGKQLAKCVVLEDEQGYLMAVIPSDKHVDLGSLHRQFNRQLGLTTEDKLRTLFTDCEPGAIPPVGEAYGIDVIVDDSLAHCSDVYFEAGDHTHLIQVNGKDFMQVVEHKSDGCYSR